MAGTHRLAQRWFARPAPIVAQELIGCALVHGTRSGMIVEAEAYLGPHDRASHARFGATARTSVMFGPAGQTYVYLCYGIHEMFNIVTGADGHGEAVLIRAIAPLAGFGGSDGRGDDPKIGRGPGKVTRALGLDRSHDRRDLAQGALYVVHHEAPPALGIGPRIGVAYAGSWARRRLRFWWRDHPAVTKS